MSYRAMQANSLLPSFNTLGMDHLLDEAERDSLESALTPGGLPQPAGNVEKTE